MDRREHVDFVLQRCDAVRCHRDACVGATNVCNPGKADGVVRMGKIVYHKPRHDRIGVSGARRSVGEFDTERIHANVEYLERVGAPNVGELLERQCDAERSIGIQNSVLMGSSEPHVDAGISEWREVSAKEHVGELRITFNGLMESEGQRRAGHRIANTQPNGDIFRAHREAWSLI